ncbi:MAG: hypothetical protein KJ737_20860 [Proteobacteria bacterium]|nr:hypothetical protein [Pseudomonadota bacterium]
MAKKRSKCLRFFLYILPTVIWCLSGCAGNTNGKSPIPPDRISFESEMKFILQQLDSFAAKEREKGAKSISESTCLEYVHTLSDSLDMTDENNCKAYLDEISRTITGIQPVISALFVSAVDIYPDVKKNSFDSLQIISSCLLKVILTTYSIKHAYTENEKAPVIYHDAQIILKNAKSLNEDIITFFRNAGR